MQFEHLAQGASLLRKRDHSIYSMRVKPVLARLSYYLIAALLPACSTVPNSPAELEITGFRQGTINMSDDRHPIIEMAGNDFVYQENGTCIADGKSIPCMWHGFEFDFISPESATLLLCDTTFDSPAYLVNPKKSYGDHISVFKWDITLEGRRGHLVYPQYSGRWDESKSYIRHSKTTCSYKGVEVLAFEFTVRQTGRTAQ